MGIYVQLWLPSPWLAFEPEALKEWVPTCVYPKQGSWEAFLVSFLHQVMKKGTLPEKV